MPVMRSSISVLLMSLLAVIAAACSSTQKTRPAVQPNDVAYFAGGCFWGVEHFLEELPGVASVESGYSGGTTQSPTYQDVISKGTGHLEVVRVRFDNKQVSFKAVAKRFFEIHDPTQADGQGPDIGAQYLSAVFYTNAQQKSDTEELIAALTKRGFAVATKLRSFEAFWPAEDYHQDYYAKSGKEPYCHGRVKRFED